MKSGINGWISNFQIMFSRQSDGEIKAFLNDKEIINYNGITSYTENSGYASKSRYYFKWDSIEILCKNQ